MKIFIDYLIIFCIVLLYCCGEHSPVTEKENNTINNSSTTLTADEEVKFNALTSGLDTIIKNTSHTAQEENKRTKYKNFMTWLSNNTQKKKELANAFTIAYNFLDEQRKRQSSGNLTTKQMIINAINCRLSSQRDAQCSDNSYAYDSNFRDNIRLFFHLLVIEINDNNTNEEVLEAITKNIRDIKSLVMIELIGTTVYNEKFKEKLNNKQRQGLDILKDALSNNEDKLFDFLSLNEAKVKEILEHIDNEIEKCSGDDVKKNTFKDVINSYFNIINEQKLDGFKDQVTSGC